MSLRFAVVVFVAIAGFAAPADAVVYCRSAGVPAGCVVRPAVPRAVAPGVGAPGVGVVPGVGAGAPGVGVRPGTPMNRGGPVDRVGRR